MAYRGVRVAFVLLDRNHRLGSTGAGGGGGGGWVTVAVIVLDTVLFAVVVSVAVVDAVADGLNVPAAGARRTTVSVCWAPDARSLTVHTPVVPLNPAVGDDTNVIPPKFTWTD